MSLYNASGQRQITIVNGSTYTGIYAVDGSYNGVINDGTGIKGLYHPCGAFNVVIVTNPYSTLQATNGSYNIIASSNGYALVGNTTVLPPSLVSASIRFQIPGTTSNAWFGQQISTNGYTYTRVGDRAVKDVKGIRKLYTTVGVSTSVTLPSFIENAWHEQGCGNGQTIRCHTLTNLSGTALNQGSATVRVDTFNDLVNDVTFVSGSLTYTMSSQLDNTGGSPVYQNRTYAQFQAAGGTVSASTVNSVSTPNTQVFVPKGWSVWTDTGVDLTANTLVFHGLEQKSPIVVVTSITAATDTAIVLTSNTDVIRVGDVGTIASATGNTTVNGTWRVSAVVAGTSITFTAPGVTVGVVTGTPTLRFAYPTHTYNAEVTFNPLGDYQKSSATQLDKIGTGDWTSIGATSLSDGGFGPGFAAIIGTDSTGGDNILIDGNSIAFGKGDNQTNDPASQPAGDAAGNTGFMQRSLYRLGIPSIRVAVPSEAAVSAFLNGDDTFRRYLCGLCDATWTDHGHNTVFSYATYTPFKTTQIDHWNKRRAAGRGTHHRVVAITLTPLTAQLLTDKWTTARNSTYQNQAGTAAFVFPGGYVYNNYHPDLRNGVLVTGTTGGVDGFVDIAHLTSNLDGSVNADDGYWPVNGITNYKFTIDGTHVSTDGNISIDAALTRQVLIAAKVILT